MIRTILIGLALLAFSFGGCSDDNPVMQQSPYSALDNLVIANCYTLQAAAEAYAADHGGNYCNEFLLSGLIDYLPDSTALENPYTNLQTVPVKGIAIYPGETGYLWFCDAYDWGYSPGYLITGCGADGEVIALSNLPRGVFYFDEETVANCLTLQSALEAFAADNNGTYPGNVDTDRSGAGKTVTDYLPGGSLMRNPYTGAKTEPVNGVAAIPGETGYSVQVDASGTNSGYYITGWGRCSDIVALGLFPPEDSQVRWNAYSFRKVIEDFAADNNGLYPRNLHQHQNLSGQTVLDMLGQLYKNPYTGLRTEPRYGFASSRGEIGYVWSGDGPTGDGYIITAWGLFGEIVRLEK